jgi:nicotinate-nucleotide adenylyltransferase
MGGTFDPIHIGHLVAASEALSAFSLDRVHFVPAGRPWQKSEYTDAEDRFMMVNMGVANHPRFAVSRIEIDRQGPTYTADTMRTLIDFYGEETSLFLIAGADAVAQLSTWEQLDELARLMEVIAVTRPGYDTKVDAPSEGPKVHELNMPGIDVSATQIRERVREGKPIDFLVPEHVVSYIKEQGLYSGTMEEPDAR